MKGQFYLAESSCLEHSLEKISEAPSYSGFLSTCDGKTEAVSLGAHHEKAGHLGEDNTGDKRKQWKKKKIEYG